jgi:hypothetical protein
MNADDIACIAVLAADGFGIGFMIGRRADRKAAVKEAREVAEADDFVTAIRSVDGLPTTCKPFDEHASDALRLANVAVAS